METTSDYKRKSWAPTNDPTENQEETVFYTSLKQAGKTAEFINFFFKDGNQKALPASSVSGLEFDPGKGLVSIFCGYASVLIHGKNMGELYKFNFKRTSHSLMFSKTKKNRILKQTKLLTFLIKTFPFR